ncbi:hypothetical protein HY091_00565 [Candidatus Kaiserbacteria bacterium]|nr:hypothetical protein [Candidatus Kaiserbacteria bacterium]
MAVTLGMPAARPFSVVGDDRVFVTEISLLREELSRAKLSECIGADLDEMRWPTFEGESIFGFSEAELRTFLDRSGLVMVQRYGSNTPDVEWVRLIKRPDLPWFTGHKLLDHNAFLEYQFQIGRWDGKNWPGVAYMITRALSPVLRRKIILDVPHQRSREYADRGAFQIYIWSTPHSGAPHNHRPPETIWGYHVDCRDGGYQPSEEGASSIMIRDGSWAVAELLPNALYVHHDLVNEGTGNELKILLRLLSEIAKLMGDPAKYQVFLARAREAHAKRQREIFCTLIEKSIPERSRRHDELVSAARGKVAQVRGKLVAAERKLFGLQQSVLDPKEVVRRFEEEILKLQKSKVTLVEEVFFKDHGGEIPRLHALTKEITSVNPSTGNTHLLGRYEIILDLEEAEVQFLNKDRRPAGFHGPHLNEDGWPCLGNIEDDMAGYIGHFEIEAALALAIAFLQSPNPDDAWGRNLLRFPVVEERALSEPA